MHILITGFPGTGKSSIAQELKRRGHTAYDPQSMRNYMRVENRDNGKHIHPPENLPAGWYDDISAYNWDPIRLLKLLSQPGDIFICSKAHNQSDFYRQFDKIFVLTLDETELESRLLSRSQNNIGHTQAERSDILRYHKHFEESLISAGAIRIDTSPAIHEVVTTILQRCS